MYDRKGFVAKKKKVHYLSHSDRFGGAEFEKSVFLAIFVNSQKMDFQSRANFSPQKEKNITILKNFKSFRQICEVGGGECFLFQGHK